MHPFIKYFAERFSEDFCLLRNLCECECAHCTHTLIFCFLYWKMDYFTLTLYLFHFVGFSGLDVLLNVCRFVSNTQYCCLNQNNSVTYTKLWIPCKLLQKCSSLTTFTTDCVICRLLPQNTHHIKLQLGMYLNRNVNTFHHSLSIFNRIKEKSSSKIPFQNCWIILCRWNYFHADRSKIVVLYFNSCSSSSSSSPNWSQIKSNVIIVSPEINYLNSNNSSSSAHTHTNNQPKHTEKSGAILKSVFSKTALRHSFIECVNVRWFTARVNIESFDQKHLCKNLSIKICEIYLFNISMAMANLNAQHKRPLLLIHTNERRIFCFFCETMTLS